MPNILHQFHIQSTPDEVFHAFTSPSGLNSWWTLESDGKPELNETYRFVFGPEYDWRAVVSHVVPGHELTWRVKQAMDDWMPTSFGFRLDIRIGYDCQFFSTRTGRMPTTILQLRVSVGANCFRGLKVTSSMGRSSRSNKGISLIVGKAFVGTRYSDAGSNLPGAFTGLSFPVTSAINPQRDTIDFYAKLLIFPDSNDFGGGSQPGFLRIGN